MTNYGGYFDVQGKQERINELSLKMNNVDFWNDKDNAEKIIEECNNLKRSVEKITGIRKKIDDNLEMLSIMISAPDEEILKVIEEELPGINKEINSLSLEIMLSGPEDKSDALPRNTCRGRRNRSL